MATPMKEWIAQAKEEYGAVALQNMSHHEFFRDPPRSQRIDHRYFFSPADGIIIGQKWCKPDGDLLETKGTQCCLKDLMCPWEIAKPCLVINIFMSFYDVHINRMPTGGIISREHAGSIRTANLPMLYVEQGIVKKGQVIKDGMTYMHDNAKMLNRVVSTNLHYTYYMVQIADSDVSAIMPFDHRKRAPLAQSERFSLVRWGSQVALVLPFDARFKFKTLCNVTDHVEAGTDALVEVNHP